MTDEQILNETRFALGMPIVHGLDGWHDGELARNPRIERIEVVA